MAGECVKIGDFAPDFTVGDFNLHKYIGNENSAVLHFGLAALTPVCSTELAAIASPRMKEEQEKRNIKLVAISRSPEDEIAKWKSDIKEATGHEIYFPVLSDKDRKIARMYGALNAAVTAPDGQPMVTRASVLIDQSKRIRFLQYYPNSMGRNTEEIIRAYDAVAMHDKYGVFTPVNWKQGEAVIVGPAAKDEVKQRPDVQTPYEKMPYVRIVKV